MNELIERVQHQLDNNYPVEKEDIQELITEIRFRNYLLSHFDLNKLQDIKPPINKPES